MDNSNVCTDTRPKGVIMTKEGPKIVIDEVKEKGKGVLEEEKKGKASQARIDEDVILAKKLEEEERLGFEQKDMEIIDEDAILARQLAEVDKLEMEAGKKKGKRSCCFKEEDSSFK